MKRFLMLAVAACLVVASVPVDAGVRLHRERINTREWLATGNVDSAAFRMVGAGAYASQETTIAIPIIDLLPSPSEWSGWRYAFNYATGGVPIAGDTAFADTSLAFIVTVQPAGQFTALTEGGDSLFISAQVSHDGVGWTAVTGAQRLSMVDYGTTETYHYTFKQSLGNGTGVGGAGQVMPVSGTAPNNVQWFGWPFVRFIIAGGSSTTGGYEVLMTRFRDF